MELIQLAQYKIIFPYRTQFQFICPHRPASWAARRAGPPVSVSLHGTIWQKRFRVNMLCNQGNLAKTSIGQKYTVVEEWCIKTINLLIFHFDRTYIDKPLYHRRETQNHKRKYPSEYNLRRKNIETLLLHEYIQRNKNIILYIWICGCKLISCEFCIFFSFFRIKGLSGGQEKLCMLYTDHMLHVGRGAR